MIVYGYTAVNSDGWFQNPNFGETRTKLFLSKEECLKKAFEDYQKVYDSLAEEGLEPENKKESENEFIKKASEDKLAGVIQLPDYHIQFEFFEQKV